MTADNQIINQVVTPTAVAVSNDIPHLSVLLCLMYEVTEKAASFERGLKQKKALQKFPLLCRLLNPSDHMI